MPCMFSTQLNILTHMHINARTYYATTPMHAYIPAKYPYFPILALDVILSFCIATLSLRGSVMGPPPASGGDR